MRIDLGLILGVFLELLILIYYANTTLYPRKNYYVSSLIALVGYGILFTVAIFGHPVINTVLFAIINIIVLITGYYISGRTAMFKGVLMAALSLLGELVIVFLIGFKLNTEDILNVTPEESMLVTIGGKTIYFIGILIIKALEKGKHRYSEKSFLVLSAIPLVTVASVWMVSGLDIDKRIFVILSFVAVFANIMAFSLNEFIITKNNQIKNLEIENSKNLFALEEYRYLNEKYEENRILRHDFKEHIRTALSLMEEDKSEAIKYLEKIEKTNSQTDFVKYTDNPILNILLLQKDKECRDKGIELHIKSSNPKIDFMEEMDIVAVFSNLINNAMEACMASEKKEISLDLYTGNNAFTVIKTENSSDTEPVIVDGTIKSNKKDIYNHGIGIKSIKNSLKKYNGDMSWSYDKENKIFRTTVLINVADLK